MRLWGLVAYALVGFVGAAFIDQVSRGYVWALGAGLRSPALVRVVASAQRMRTPLQSCAVEGEVGAISPIGAINYSECHYCLDGQKTCNNDHKCPPRVERCKKREKRESAVRPLPTSVFIAGPEAAAAPAEARQ